MNPNIAILTTVISFELYNKTSSLFPEEIRTYVIDGTNGMHGINSIKFMMKKLKNSGIKWLILVDEDVIFIKPNLIFSIIEEMEEKNITVCGVRDGGEIANRKQNPYVINTFFSIINFGEIQNIYDEKEVLKNQYILENEFDDDIESLQFDFNKMVLYEPYYCFFLWLRRKGKKILFLKSTQLNGYHPTNCVLYNDEEILLHTWFAPSYGVNEKHTKRINEVLNDVKIKIKNNQKPIVFKDKTFYLREHYRKLMIKLKMKF